jgi:hypothetical protein
MARERATEICALLTSRLGFREKDQEPRRDEVEETIATVLATEVAKSRCYSRFIYFDFVACSIYWKAA